MKKDYHELKKGIGQTDIGAATIVYFDPEARALKTLLASFCGDGFFKVYCFDESEAEAPIYYKKEASFICSWLTVYDDDKAVFKKSYGWDGKQIELLTCGRGLIIKSK